MRTTTRSARPAIVPAAILALALLAAPGGARAQETPEAPAPRSRWEFIVPGGLVVPTGAQRDAIQRANLTAAQLSWVVRPALALTATVGWGRSRDVASAGEPKLDLFTYDLGAEVRASEWTNGSGLTFMPFAGMGAGARTYDYRSLEVDATHNPAAYAGVGGEVGYGRFGLRVEARDYVTGFKPLAGVGVAETRNDVAVLVGLRFDW